ncbi:glycosyltransferase family protein [Mesorhizobium sp. M0830]
MDSFSAIENGSCEVEFVPIHAARSMTSGYNLGIDRASGDWLIFCHDDIEIIRSRSRMLSYAFEEFDVFGVCGTSRCQSSNWYYSDPGDLLGRVVVPGDYAGQEDKIEVFSPVEDNCKAQALDGIFIASRASVARELRFSEEIPGFTCYDIDFSYRCHIHGYNVGVTGGLLMKHYSKVDSFSERKMSDWKLNQRIISTKFNFYRKFDDGVRHFTVPFTEDL